MSSISSRIASAFFAPFMIGLTAAPDVLSAQTSFVPTNPISPPTVSPPVLSPVPTLDVPVVTAPTISADSGESSPGSTASTTTSPESGSSAKTSSTATTPTRTTVTTTTSGSPSATAKSTSTVDRLGAGGAKSASSNAATASALSMLGFGSSNPLLKALSGSDSDENGTDALSGLLGASSSSTDSATLKKVLDLLEKQQAQTGAAATAGPAGTAAAAGTTGRTASKAVGGSTATVAATGAAATAGSQSITSGGELVRFIVNGYNVAASTTTLVSSILAKDGSFLLTGDRRYVASRENRTETFYLLCRKNADGSYRLHADVTQDAKNEYSFLYRLSRRGPLKGTMTGDLLVFRTVDPDFRLDLVIRVIAPSVSKKSNR